MKIAIIILVWNGKKYLLSCLESLFKQSYPLKNFEIIIVDNASRDGSVEYLRKNWPHLTIIQNKKNLGFAQGNNIGMRYALERGFNWVVLLNQDTLVDKEWLEELVKAGETDGKIAAVQAMILLHQNKTKIQTSGNKIHYLGFGYSGDYKEPLLTSNFLLLTYPIAYASGASVLLRASALGEVGLFNPFFFAYHEDLDLSWRLRLQGWKIVLAPSSCVYHKYSFSRHPRKFYFMERNRWWVILQSYRLPTLILLAPALLIMEIGLLNYSARGGWFLWKIKSYGWILKHLLQILETRQEIQRKRKVGDREMVKYFTGKIEFEDIDSPIVKYIMNPVFSFYWEIVRRLIFW